MVRAKALPMVLVALLASAPLVEAAQEYLTPTWSRTLGKGGRWLTAEEDGRCFVIAERGAILVLTPSGDVAWRWSYSKINRLIDPQKTAVSPDCDAIAMTGSSNDKHTWLVDRAGTSVAIPTAKTPADVAFDPTGKRISIGTFGGTLQVHNRAGDLLERHDGARRFYDEPADGVVPESTVTIAVSADGSRRWLANSDRIACVDGEGTVLAEIPTQTFYRDVIVSRDFGSVVRINRAEKTTTIYKYSVAPPCKP
jgi:DNA-binding beta-propeller fold protein YncE